MARRTVLAGGDVMAAKPAPAVDLSDLDAIAAEGERSDRTTGLLVRILVVIARELRLLRAGQRP